MEVIHQHRLEGQVLRSSGRCVSRVGKFFLLCAVVLVPLAPGRAGSVETRFVADKDEEKTPLNLFTFEGGYTFESRISDERANFGRQDAFEVQGEYSHLFRLGGRWYLRVGLSYNRFDFNASAAPVPGHVQSAAALLSLDYMMGADRGAFLEVRPGFYGQDNFDRDSFDAPITLARAWVLRPEKIYIFTGVNVAFLRGEYPVLPLAGLIWCFNEQWMLYGVVPEPRLVYMPNKKLDLWIGGQITGGSFRTKRDDTIVPRALNHAVVDYADYRAGAGFVWHISDGIDLDVAGGYSIQRRFNYERAGKEFTTEPAPYVRVSLKAEF